MLTTIITLGGFIVGTWAIVKYILLIETRIDNNTFRILYDVSKEKRLFLLQEEFFTESRHPVIYKAICLFDDIPWFYISHSERLLQAGFQGKDLITTIICARWNYKKVKTFLHKNLNQLQVSLFGLPVRIATPWQTDKIGSLRNCNKPVHPENVWKDFYDDVGKVLDFGGKTGAILHGEPGNGKTLFVKFLAIKYNLPITIITFVPEFTNIDIMYMFSQIPSNCIVLLEDFDNYFDKRKCIIGEGNNGGNNMIKFTFDVILNCLDGIYNSYDKVVFIMTVNDLEKVDEALKNRPSRFKFVKLFPNPDYETRYQIIEEWADQTSDLNLDQIWRLKEFRDLGFTLEQSKQKLGIHQDFVSLLP